MNPWNATGEPNRVSRAGRGETASPMSRERHAETHAPAGRLHAWSMRIAEFIDHRLADARAHAQRGRLAQAKERLLELRTGLVGHSPGDGAGLLRDASSPLRNRAAAHHPIGLDRPLHRDISGQPAAADTGRGVSPTVGRSDWLEAIQLSAQAISDLTAISTVSNSPTRPEIRPEAMAAWEARHRDRIGRWARAPWRVPRLPFTATSIVPTGKPRLSSTDCRR